MLLRARLRADQAVAKLNPDSRFYQGWTLAADVVILNLLTIAASLPVVTAGAARAATARVTGQMVREEDTYVLATWWSAFKANFRQATIGWIPLAILLALTWWESRIIGNQAEGTIATLMMALVILGAVIACAIFVWYIGLVVNFANTASAHAANAVRLTIGALPNTAGIVLILVLPLLLTATLPDTIMVVLGFMAVIGFGFAWYMFALFQKPVLAKLGR